MLGRAGITENKNHITSLQRSNLSGNEPVKTSMRISDPKDRL